MTLEPYNPDRIDQLALRVLDVCARLRAMAQTCREQQLPAIDLHDRKALEWLAKMEEWAVDAESAVFRAQGKQKAQSLRSGRDR